MCQSFHFFYTLPAANDSLCNTRMCPYWEKLFYMDFMTVIASNVLMVEQYNPYQCDDPRKHSSAEQLSVNECDILKGLGKIFIVLKYCDMLSRRKELEMAKQWIISSL